MAGVVNSVGPYRMVLADEEELLLEALSGLLAPEFDVVGTAHNGVELVDCVKEHKPDAVLTEIALPRLNGLDACSKILSLAPEVAFIILTSNDDPGLVAESIRMGASGYLLKTCSKQDLLQAIRAVQAGGKYISPMVMDGMVDSLLHDGHHELFETLTSRQREILQLLSEGRRMKEIASSLNITARTVAFHKYRIMKVLDIHNNADLIRMGSRLRNP